MSLWTPGGEIPVDRGGNQGPSGAPPGAGSRGPGAPGSGGPAPDPAAGGAAGLAGGPSLDDLSPEERVQAEAMIQEMAEVQQQIAATPASQLVANHAMGLYELAAIKLSQDPPRFAEAQLAIDAMAAVLEATAERMGQDAVPLRQGLTQLQLAFVELKKRGDDATPG